LGEFRTALENQSPSDIERIRDDLQQLIRSLTEDLTLEDTRDPTRIRFTLDQLERYRLAAEKLEALLEFAHAGEPRMEE